VEFCGKVLFKKIVVNMAIKLHNTVPESIKKKVDNFKLFKKELKRLLLSHSFQLTSFYSFE